MTKADTAILPLLEDVLQFSILMDHQHRSICIRESMFSDSKHIVCTHLMFVVYHNHWKGPPLKVTLFPFMCFILDPDHCCATNV